MPSILLSGFAFPWEGMPRPAQLLSEVLPLTHYLRIVRGITLKGAEFGEPCGGDDGTPCADGLECYIGYCEEKCVDDSDCQPVDGYRHECESGGVCHIYCNESTLACPQDLGTTLQCGVIWCSGGT